MTMQARNGQSTRLYLSNNYSHFILLAQAHRPTDLTSSASSYHTTLTRASHYSFNMAPAAIVPEIVDVIQPKQDKLGLPAPTKARLEKADIDLSKGYPVCLPCRDHGFSKLTRRPVPAREASLSSGRIRRPRL